MDFQKFKRAVAKQFDGMLKHGRLFRVNIDRDLLWSTYLSAFPAGTDPMFRKRTEHDCSCCRQFIRAIGDVVAIVEIIGTKEDDALRGKSIDELRARLNELKK